jgi:enoyl-CoA hydratase/carnithine racemase
MEHGNLIIEQEGNVGIITMNRPPANPIDLSIIDPLDDVLTKFERDNSVRVLVITGAGDRAFSAGYDVKVTGKLEESRTGIRGFAIVQRIGKFPKPTIAAINGYCLGGACELAMACHFRIMVDTEHAVIGLPDMELGLIPGWGGTQRLPRLVGRTKAIEMLTLSKKIGANEAYGIGLVTRVSSPGETLKDAKELAETLAKKPPIALQLLLDAVNRGLDTTLEEAWRLNIEGENYRKVIITKDFQEGMRAFMEKREPVWKGE